MSGVSPDVVAKHILSLRRDLETTPMQLNKLVFLCHGWMLGNTGTRLIDEEVEAWPYGPVVPSIYHEYKGYRSNPIDTRQISIERDRVSLTDDQKQSIKKTETFYRRYGAWQLSEITHSEGSPWRSSRDAGDVHIPTRRIKRYYRNKVKEIRRKIETKNAHQQKNEENNRDSR